METTVKRKRNNQQKRTGNAKPLTTKAGTEGDIAIIGIACRLPGANNAADFWSNLENGVNSIREIPAERWDINRYYSPDMKEPNKSVSKWVGLLEGADRFDNRFFSITPREALSMAPQQRLLLEETWHCIEDAGVPLRTLQEKKTSVFLASLDAEYRQSLMAGAVEIDSFSTLGNFDSFIANRMSYTFGFHGVSVPINVACASVITGIHEAKISLRSGESDYAICGGVNLNLHPWKYMSFSKLRLLSPDGQCKTFDKDANGYVPGDGVGVLLLQRLSDAIRDGNHIYGVVKGTGVNHTGQGLSLTAPLVEAQKAVALEAYRDAGVSPETISYVEAQGTGTSLGDPIEVEALSQAFREYTDAKQFCKIGVFKTNIGHLEAASGAAAIIKVLMMMKHRKVPQILHLKQPNPMIDFANSPFSIATELTDWESPVPGEPLRAGINSLSFSGANAHLLLEEYRGEQAQVVLEPPTERLFVLSAKTANSLTEQVQAWQAFAKSAAFAEMRVHDICATLRSGRQAFEYRVGARVSTHDEIAAFLEQAADTVVQSKGQLWGLRVGQHTWQGAVELQPLVEASEWLRKRLDAIVQKYARFQPRLNLQKRFEAAVWAEEDRAPFSQLVALAIVTTLQEVGFSPRLITGERTSVWVSLVASGMVELDAALAVLSGKQTMEQVALARPTVPFVDPVSGQVIQPFAFDAAYVRGLLSEASGTEIVEALFSQYAEQAKMLIESQFTFKKSVEEWNDVVQKAVGQDVRVLLVSTELRVQEKRMLLVIILSALQKLADKWKLSEQHAVVGTNLQELVHLVTDEVLSKKMTAALVLAEEPDVAVVAAHLHERQPRLDLTRPYARLRESNHAVHEIPDLAAWWAQVTDAEAPLLDEALRVLELGTLVVPSDESRRVTVENVQQTLLQLWLAGVAIDWAQIEPEGTHRKVSLPVYHFEHKSFWVKATTMEEDAQTVSPSAEVQQEVLAMLQRAEREAAAGREEEEHSADEQVSEVAEVTQVDYKKLHLVLTELFAKALGIDVQEVGDGADLREFGMDSVSLTDFSDRINRRLNTDINSSLLFQYSTIQEIADYLIDAYPELEKDYATVTTTRPVDNLLRMPQPVAASKSKQMPATTRQNGERKGKRDVAIIGISGRFPSSENTRQFWEHLAANRDLIREIPLDRWNWQDYFGDPHEFINKCIVRWGGFLDDIKGFDASFFKISPKEAELMDPQQRLVLEEAWHAIEDAGYKPSSLSGSPTGVFVGICHDDYRELLLQNDVPENAYTSTGNYFSIVPNRISYQLNLRGPSIAYETACSSSLVAIHQAVAAIENGECNLALAGGVNLISSPIRYLSFDNAGMLSRDGRCKTFDSSANGYARGEGVGMILLKDLEQAVQDGDHIYGVIKGSAVNHGGYANSLTAPNPNAQADLIVSAWEQAELLPDTASYIEAHGTGTSLGDPIEINGLKKAFDELYKRSGKKRSKSGYIGIGTAKTSIGHLEAAAGIAGVIKLLLSMKHGMLTGNIHFKEINPYVQLDGSPFSIVQQNQEWQRMRDEQGQEIPRRAGVSSFGIGGTNAHIVLEEYQHVRAQSEEPNHEPKIVVLSAKNEDRLRAVAKDLHQYLNRYVIAKEDPVMVQEAVLEMVSDVLQIATDAIDVHEHLGEYGFDTLALNDLANRINDRFGTDVTADVFTEFATIAALSTHLLVQNGDRVQPLQSKEAVTLDDIAYTLQVGREEMDERLAFVVTSVEELAEKLLVYTKGRLDASTTYKGNVKDGKQASGLLLDGEEGEAFVRMIVGKRRLDKIAQLWVMGVAIDWHLLHGEGGQKRVSLPGYAFEKRPFWFDAHLKKLGTVRAGSKQTMPKAVTAPAVKVPVAAPVATPVAAPVTMPVATVRQAVPVEKVRDTIASIVETVLHLERDEVREDTSFKELGMDSISGVELIKRVNKQYDLNLEAMVIYDFSSVDTLAAHVAEQMPTELVQTPTKQPQLWNEPPRVESVQVVESDEDKIMRLLQRLQDEDVDLEEVDQFLEEIL